MARMFIRSVNKPRDWLKRECIEVTRQRGGQEVLVPVDVAVRVDVQLGPVQERHSAGLHATRSLSRCPSILSSVIRCIGRLLAWSVTA